jgi:hypothetical protein
MKIVADGQESYVASNGGKIRKARKLVRLEVYRRYKLDISNAGAARCVYLKCKRWLELQRKLNRLEQDLSRNLYLNISDT